jgi:hypothetical protein
MSSNNYSPMHIRMSWLRRQALCAWVDCSLYIESGEPTVRGTIYKNNMRHTFIWHPQCYIQQGMVYLNAHPYEAQEGGPGRKALDLTEDQKRKRHNLLAKAHRLRKQRVDVIERGWFWKLDYLGEDYRKVCEELEQYGGMPSHWR